MTDDHTRAGELVKRFTGRHTDTTRQLEAAVALSLAADRSRRAELPLPHAP